MANVLVVEDNFANQRLMTLLLESLGHGVTCAGTGEEGLALVQGRTFDLIVLDMHLPGMDGFQLAGRIKELRGGSAKILAVTALAMEGDRERVLASGCDGYLSKPISIPALREQVSEMLGETGEDSPGDGRGQT